MEMRRTSMKHSKEMEWLRWTTDRTRAVVPGCLVGVVNEAVTQVDLWFAPSLTLFCPLQTKPSPQRITRDAKEKPQTCRHNIQPTQRIPRHTFVAIEGSDVASALSSPNSLCLWGDECLHQVPAQAKAGGSGTPTYSRAICR